MYKKAEINKPSKHLPSLKKAFHYLTSMMTFLAKKSN